MVQDGLVFKGSQLVIPYSLRRQMMEMIHDTHMALTDVFGELESVCTSHE